MKQNEMIEADITINGKALTFAESMTLRVAVSSYLMSMNEPNALGPDLQGREIAAGYARSCCSILQAMQNQSLNRDYRKKGAILENISENLTTLKPCEMCWLCSKRVFVVSHIESGGERYDVCRKCSKWFTRISAVIAKNSAKTV